MKKTKKWQMASDAVQDKAAERIAGWILAGQHRMAGSLSRRINRLSLAARKRLLLALLACGALMLLLGTLLRPAHNMPRPEAQTQYADSILLLNNNHRKNNK